MNFFQNSFAYSKNYIRFTMFRYYRFLARNIIMSTKRQTSVTSFFQSSEPVKKAKKEEKPIESDDIKSNVAVSIVFYNL